MTHKAVKCLDWRHAEYTFFVRKNEGVETFEIGQSRKNYDVLDENALLIVVRTAICCTRGTRSNEQFETDDWSVSVKLR